MTYSDVGRILTKRGLKHSANFDHAHLITSRAAPRGMYVRTYGYDMGWRGAIERVIVMYVARWRCESYIACLRHRFIRCER